MKDANNPGKDPIDEAFGQIKCAIANIERAKAEYFVLDEATQTISYRGNHQYLSEYAFELIRFLAIDNCGKPFSAVDIAHAIGATPDNGITSKNYVSQKAGEVRNKALRRLVSFPYEVLQHDDFALKYRWNPVYRVVLLVKSSMAPGIQLMPGA